MYKKRECVCPTALEKKTSLRHPQGSIERSKHIYKKEHLGGGGKWLNDLLCFIVMVVNI